MASLNRRLVCGVLALLLLVYASLWFRLRSPASPASSDDFLVLLPPKQQHEAGQNPSVLLQETICPRGAELCFKVEDHVLPDQRTASGLSYQRRLMVETVDDVVLSVALLEPKPEEPFRAQNTAHWPVRKTSLVLGYSRVIVGQMLATGCAPLDAKGRQTRTLMIGLGGGAIPSMLTELDANHEVTSIELEPAMEYIARRWFGLEESQRQRVLIRNGEDFITDWRESDSRFDCIVIDACVSTVPSADADYPLMCPPESFVANEEMVRKLFQMLRITGTLLVNTFVVETEANAQKVAEKRQFLLELFRHTFGYCYYASDHYNRILVCTLALPKDEPMSDALYERKIREWPEWLRRELRSSVRIENELWRPEKSEM